MKKLLTLIILCCLLPLSMHAQIFNTSSTLKPGRFNVGFEPGIYAGGDADFTLFLHGGVGLTKGADLGLKLGVLSGNVYFGGDVEFCLNRYFSFSAGAHSWGNFGLDFTGLVTLPIRNVAKFYTGLDADIIFSEPDTKIPLWIPLGLEIPLRSNMYFHFETEINVSEYGSHFIGGGLNFII